MWLTLFPLSKPLRTLSLISWFCVTINMSNIVFHSPAIQLAYFVQLSCPFQKYNIVFNIFCTSNLFKLLHYKLLSHSLPFVFYANISIWSFPCSVQNMSLVFQGSFNILQGVLHRLFILTAHIFSCSTWYMFHYFLHV